MSGSRFIASMLPSHDSSLFSDEEQCEMPASFSFPSYPSGFSQIQHKFLPNLIEVSPLAGNPKEFGIFSPIPRCSSCHSYYFERERCDSSHWTCHFCGYSNPLSQISYINPGLCYKFVVEPSKDPPLYVFAFQSRRIFTKNGIMRQILSVIASWAASAQTLVSLVSFGSHLTVFNPEKATSQTLYDVSPASIPFAKSNDINIQKLLDGFTEEIGGYPMESLTRLLSAIAFRNICLVLFLSDFAPSQPLPTQLDSIFEAKNISLHIFSFSDVLCPELISKAYRAIFVPKESPEILPEELQYFLNSSAIFDANISAIASSSIKLSFNKKINFIDGQSSFIIEAFMEAIQKTQQNYFQILISAVEANGNESIFVINAIQLNSMYLERFNASIFVSFIARKLAIDTTKQGPLSAYQELKKFAIIYFSAWRDNRQNEEQIPPQMRDAPILMYALSVSELFLQNYGALIAAVNFANISSVRLRNQIYPQLIIPPVKFPHRLCKSSVGQFGIFFLIRAFDGIAYSDRPATANEVIINAKKRYKVPIAVSSDSEIVNNLLIEDRRENFEVFCLKIFAEMNTIDKSALLKAEWLQN